VLFRSDALKNAPGGGGAGDLQVTIHLQGGMSEPIVDAGIQVFDSTGTMLQDLSSSEVDGNCILALDAGTYKVRLSKQTQYTFTVPETMIVDGSHTSFVFIGTAIPIPTPATPDLQRLYFFASDLGLVSDVNASIVATYTMKNEVVQNTVISKKLDAIYDAVHGYYYWDIAKGANVQITGYSDSLQFLNTFGTLDDSDTKNLVSYTWF
jgi:hypothetical protein